MIKTIIVDDERPARELIEWHLSELNGFQIVASLDNAIDAFNFLQERKVDLVFLDIAMPKVSGLELLRSLNAEHKTILTTAFREFAVDAFDLGVFDYLIKPITTERFMKAINKFMLDWNRQNETESLLPKEINAYMYFKVGRVQTKIYLEDISYVEGFSDYTKIHTKNGCFIASEKLGYITLKLPANQFLRIHKSFVIALNKIVSYSADRVTLADQTLPLGRLFKSTFFKVLKSD